MLQLSPQLLTAASNLSILAESLVEGYGHGLHRSPFKGSSQEFCSYRPYLPGDPVKLVDWKLWARSDSFFIREFEQETNYRGYLFLDVSKSMDYGSGAQNKFTYSRILCAVIIMIMKRQKDAPGLAFIGADAFSSSNWIPPSGQRDHFEYLISSLEQAEANGLQDHFGDLSGLLEEVSSRSLAIIVSDGYTPKDQLKEFLEQLGTRGLETIFFHICAPEEIKPNFEGDLILVDSETGDKIPVDGAALTEVYQEKLDSFLNEIEEICQNTQTGYCRVVSDEPLDGALQHYLEMRGVKK